VDGDASGTHTPSAFKEVCQLQSISAAPSASQSKPEHTVSGIQADEGGGGKAAGCGGAGGRISVQCMNWLDLDLGLTLEEGSSSGPDGVTVSDGVADVVLGSDLVYDMESARVVADVTKKILKSGGWDMGCSL